MVNRKVQLGVASAAFALTLAACSDTGAEPEISPESEEMEMAEGSHEGMDMGEGSHEEMGMAEGAHEGMEHAGSGEVPEGLRVAENPTFEVGSQVIVEADHMPGMQGVEATVSGAYDTVVYSISYTTESGETVDGHKWVIHEELEDPGEEPLEPGTEVVVTADHMEGMEGATATIDTAEETTVYTIDYVTASGEVVANHMWVTGDELSAE
ncbi:YdhK family protein [Indiicoccus explosivorum]|uniref:YdhK family protein n=1 Tax=Indiicoccus explosivorum TaxID=1917864 RepID=UPI000B42E3D6|nr:YdhK family protein [Indiicoccus explosivorum]